MGEVGRARMWVLAFVVAFPAGLGILVGVGCAINANACPFSDPAPEPTTGEAIWLANCAVCHGVDGAGSSASRRAPSLVSGASASLDLETLIDRIGRGSLGLMPRFRTSLSDDQIQTVAEYVLTLRGNIDE
jgi:mono/diheme cytochrome c family protein